ncbi:organic hydroperoxide resistance protein [Mesorhizobium sp. 43Arga]
MSVALWSSPDGRSDWASNFGDGKKERTVKDKSENEKGKVIYTAKIRTTGGRDQGISRSSDGYLDVKLAAPGSGRIGTNPEQLFAAGWSACFEAAIALAARKRSVALRDVTIDAEVDLHLADNNDYFLSARFNISIPGIDAAVAQDLVRKAERLCPYSKATHGNIKVALKVFPE